MELKDLEEEVSFYMTTKCAEKKLGLNLALSLSFTVFAMGKLVDFSFKFHLSFCPCSMFLIFGMVIIEKLEKDTDCLREGKGIFKKMFYVVNKS